MRLIIGGTNQGKLNWLLEHLTDRISSSDIAEGSSLILDEIPSQLILNHLHLWIRHLLKEGKDPSQMVRAYVDQHPDCIILCDEIGCGLVPIDSFEREWREAVGRICCYLAEQSTQVDRIFCGICTTIKKVDL